VEGPACKNIETLGIFKENGSIGSWIFDPTVAAVVDRAVSPAHGSMVNRGQVVRSVLIRTARARSHGPSGLQAPHGGEHAGTERGAAMLPWRSPRSGYGAPFRARAASTRS
jgi:hypothetical protein